MIRLGLCCIFREHPVRFRRTTYKFLSGFSAENRLTRLSELCMHNAKSLMDALIFCRDNGIGGFRISSRILPLKTHPAAGYEMDTLPGSNTIMSRFRACGDFCRKNGIRTSFHPDQFILLSSPDPAVAENSVAELFYHAEVADWVNADVINIHAGGVYNDKKSALSRLRKAVDSLPDKVRDRLTLENDDRSYSPADLLPFCRDMEIPLVYDVHHHRCLPDGMTIEKATDAAIATWNREPLFHLSSPLHGWNGPDIRKHHDYIDPGDFPGNWLPLNLTVEVEAKAKELAVLKLKKELAQMRPAVKKKP